jgi:Kef-type K+ transport system membrane component KefB
MPSLVLLIVQLAVIIGTSRAVGGAFRRIGQPTVIGEMFAGIMLGPSLLGSVAPSLSASLFPPDALAYPNALSQVGIVIYMFLVGLDLNVRAVREQTRAAIITSQASIIVPFVFGATLALYLHPRLANEGVSVTTFALFIGASMSITAFPVLARILAERRMLGTRLGSLAIACAAVNDVTGWCILAYVVFQARAESAAPMTLGITIAGLALFLGVMLFGATRLFRRFETAYRKAGAVSDDMLALLLVIAMVCAVVTEGLGLHLLFGAFLAGVAMPKDSGFVSEVLDRLETVTLVLLLPLYFAFTGLRTNVTLIAGPEWLICLAIVIIAIAGKLGGTLIAARLAGTPWRQAAGLGILMNTRGLMELVILNVGLDIGVLSPNLFSMMVLMALVTTFMTAPLLQLVYPDRLLRAEIALSTKP